MFTPCTGGDEFSCANFAVALASWPGFGHISGRSLRAGGREGCLTPSGVDLVLRKGRGFGKSNSIHVGHYNAYSSLLKLR